MHRNKIISLILCCVTAVAVFAAPVRAQSPAAEIRGLVTDPRGGAIVGAKVTLVFPDKSQKVVATDQQGAYSFKSLIAGTYTLRVLAKGFSVFEQTDLVIARGQKSVQDVQLKIGTVTEDV